MKCYENSQYLKKRLKKSKGIELAFETNNFHEIVIKTKKCPSAIINQMAEHQILAGVDVSQHYPELGHALCICVTETKTKYDIDLFVKALNSHL